MKIIDPHLHLFELEQGQYGWLRPDNPPRWPDKKVIQRNFTERDLQLSTDIDLAGFVHIEAGFDNDQSWREVEWLEKTISKPFKSIACVDLTWPIEQFKAAMIKLQEFSSFVGVRHILDDDCLEILTHANAKQNLITLAEQVLIFELQMPVCDPFCTDKLLDIVTDIPDLRLALNHGGWPPALQDLDNKQYQLWLTNLSKLASLRNCVVKGSGWEMVNREYSDEWQHRIIEKLVEIFGQDRVMLGSNFPLTLFSRGYNQLWQSYRQIADLEVRQALCFDNARRFYGF